MCPEIKSPLNEAHVLVFSSLPRLTISTLFNFKRAIAGHLGAKQLNMNPASVGLSMTKEYSRSVAKSRKWGGQETIQQILVTPIKILTPPSLTRASKHPGPCPLSTASAEHTRAVRKVQWRLGCRHVDTWSRLTSALNPAGYDIWIQRHIGATKCWNTAQCSPWTLRINLFVTAGYPWHGRIVHQKKQWVRKKEQSIQVEERLTSSPAALHWKRWLSWTTPCTAPPRFREQPRSKCTRNASDLTWPTRRWWSPGTRRASKWSLVYSAGSGCVTGIQTSTT